MSDRATLLRQLKIKSGVAKRLYKEHRSYILEEEQQKIKLDKFVAENAEDWDIKNAVRDYSYGVLCYRRMLEESGRMITTTASKLGDAVQDLRQLMVRRSPPPLDPLSRDVPRADALRVLKLAAEQDPSLAGDAEVLKAQEVLEEVSI
ncbi:hypothetical protein EIP86_004588 [Pleurotus ostreatoroseus]|nr:hypothetical protein EIP86_004588 [Pleurotus ostreatoroseus]